MAPAIITKRTEMHQMPPRGFLAIDEERVPAHANPPGYWMHETSGVLRPAVLAYLGGTASGHLTLSAEHIAALRAYLRQWIGATVWDQNPHAGAEEKAWLAEMRADVDKLESRAAIAAWLDRAVDGGLDPL